jgi:hypothetical protein
MAFDEFGVERKRTGYEASVRWRGVCVDRDPRQLSQIGKFHALLTAALNLLGDSVRYDNLLKEIGKNIQAPNLMQILEVH